MLTSETHDGNDSSRPSRQREATTRLGNEARDRIYANANVKNVRI